MIMTINFSWRTMLLLSDPHSRDGRQEVGEQTKELSRKHPRANDDGGRSMFPDCCDCEENFQ
jgi:hypothetical protein